MTQVIIQLGSANWQRDGEPAAGAGILHELQHRSFNRLPDTHAYSLIPSRLGELDRDDVRVMTLDHDLPVFESVSPTSSNRWHSMSDDDVASYVQRLTVETESWIDALEARHQAPVSLAVAHHAFVHPIVLADINERRLAAGRARIRVLCFVHGDAVRMHQLEAAGERPIEFPRRFVPMMFDEGVFAASGSRAVDWVAGYSVEELDRFRAVFPDYPMHSMLLSPHGYDDERFEPVVRAAEVPTWRRQILPTFATRPHPDSAIDPTPVPGDYDHYVVFCGRFAESKRLDALLHAAAIWERDPTQRIATLIVGTGPDDAVRTYESLAHDVLQLRDVYFLGQRTQADLAALFTAADLVCIPARNEPQGLAFIEAMACGTPVIGAHSGGPREFVNDDTGLLVLDSDDPQVLADRLADAVIQGLRENWKTNRGACARRCALAHFRADAHAARLVSPSAREPVLA